jgi:hypothetical protein
VYQFQPGGRQRDFRRMNGPSFRLH